MGIITPQMVQKTYEIAIQVYKGQIHKKKGGEILSQQYKMNETSAIGYIDNVNYMLKGERYHWQMKPYDTDYFLSMIKKDFGQDTHKRALHAVEKHNEYISEIREKKSGNKGIKKHKHHNVVDEFEIWMISRDDKSPNTASSYKSAINHILEHYSQQTSKTVDLTDFSFIKILVKDYDIGGKYQAFGEKGNATYRNAIKAYARFLEDKKPENKQDKSKLKAILIKKYKQTDPPAINPPKTTLPEELIDNIIIVKSGLRVLAKVLIPYVSKYLDESNKVKLDVSKCLQELLDNWNKIYLKDIRSKHPEPEQVYQCIHALRTDRNINAHDGSEDIPYRVAKRSLDNMDFLCDALGAVDASKTIKEIISTLKN